MTKNPKSQSSLFDLQKSKHILDLEEKFLSLEKDKHTLNTELKVKKIKFDNLKKDLDSIEQEMASLVIKQMTAMDTMKKEILTICDKLIANKKLSKLEEKEIKLMQKELNDQSDPFKDYMKQFKDKEEIDFEHFKDKNIAPKPEEKRNIRKVYLRLATQFHPDKAKNDQEKEHFHVLMGILNEAYENHDIEALLSLENEYVKNDFSIEGMTVDNDYEDKLKQNITRLSEEIKSLKSQLTRLNQEIKKINNSPKMEILKKKQENKDPFKEINQKFDQTIKSLEFAKKSLEKQLNGEELDLSELMKFDQDIEKEMEKEMMESMKAEFAGELPDSIIEKLVKKIVDVKKHGGNMNKKKFAEMTMEIMQEAMFEEMLQNSFLVKPRKKVTKKKVVKKKTVKR